MLMVYNCAIMLRSTLNKSKINGKTKINKKGLVLQQINCLGMHLYRYCKPVNLY